MNKIVMVPIPVWPEGAEALGDAANRARVGWMVSDLLRPGQAERVALGDIVRGIKERAACGGLTDDEVELAGCNGEHRL